VKRGHAPDGRSELPPQTRKRVESAERALQLLKVFATPGEHLTLAVLAQRSALHKSTILRLAASLDYMGFLRRNPDGRFYLGPEVQRLGLLSLSQTPRPLEDMVRPSLQRLVAASRETASFYVLDGQQRICLFRENSLHPRRHVLEEGMRQPLDGGASAQILKSFVAEPMQPRSRAIQDQGWAVSHGGRDPDLVAIAVPIRDARHRVFGAMGISSSRERLTPSKLERARRLLLREAALLNALLTR
jgi:DNA-binding IclR family transcriptional regulator